MHSCTLPRAKYKLTENRKYTSTQTFSIGRPRATSVSGRSALIDALHALHRTIAPSTHTPETFIILG